MHHLSKSLWQRKQAWSCYLVLLISTNINRMFHGGAWLLNKPSTWLMLIMLHLHLASTFHDVGTTRAFWNHRRNRSTSECHHGNPNGNVGIAIINHPPFITIFMGGINHQKWVVYYCYTHINPHGKQTMVFNLSLYFPRIASGSWSSWFDPHATKLGSHEPAPSMISAEPPRSWWHMRVNYWDMVLW